MSLAVKSQPGTAKILRFSISSSNTPIALQYNSSVLRPKQMLCTNRVKTFSHIKSLAFKKNIQSKKNHYDQMQNSDVQNKHQTLQRN